MAVDPYNTGGGYQGFELPYGNLFDREVRSTVLYRLGWIRSDARGPRMFGTIRYGSRTTTRRLRRWILSFGYRRCGCAKSAPREGPDRPDRFEAHRSRCAALREIFIPDDIREDFERAVLEPPDSVAHQSILFLAFQRGYTRNLTRPVHRFLLIGSRQRGNVSRNYTEDLKERWLFIKPKNPTDEPLELYRHRKSREFVGKVVELLSAFWLEGKSWKITSLAALGGEVDIEANSPSGLRTAFEVKYIGQQDIEFCFLLEVQGGGAVSLPGALNFLNLTVYKAARQLEGRTGRRVVLIVFDQFAWHTYEIPLQEEWINWHKPAFKRADKQWETFFNRLPQRPSDQDLRAAAGGLSEIWLVRMNERFELVMERCVRLERTEL